ncbi:MAG: glutamate synthase-related protein, partial [bacterium]|nr:glutamate synthase-related protein [bacterium]
HHDIYSIEDLKQLIHDLKNANPAARVHVKLAAEVGVGTVAAGVAKARADVVLVSGHDGGTGASPLTSLKHAGAPWELGLAETQQTLVLNNLRDRVVVQTDGQLKTGRDVVIAALLGAEEFGFASAPLVVSGCIMMRVCHKDTCPVGVATQNPELRARFTGKPEYVMNFFLSLAQEVRELLASLGLRSLEEAVGRVELLSTRKAVDHWKAAGLDLAPLLEKIDPAPGSALHHARTQEHGLEEALDVELIAAARPALEDGTAVRIERDVRNVNRTVGTMLSHEVTVRHGAAGLPEDTIEVSLTGSAGQSFGAVLAPGVTLRLYGDANDYVGKSLSGGRIVVRPEASSHFWARENVIAGNVVGYGATSGEILLRGRAGERFAVRNSGATMVVEGVGDHACEYMTGGTVLVLGPTGKNFGAGMSGGTAYVLDLTEAKLSPQAMAEGALILETPSESEVEEIRELLRRHQEWTGSHQAAELLEEDRIAERFTVVVPRAYAAVRLVLTEAAAEGLEGDDMTVWDRVMEASRG